MPTRRSVLYGGAAAVASLAAPKLTRAAAASVRKPNLLYILADDHAGYVLGADGNTQAVTPNLDRLAAEGTRFARHYCNSPVCTPSRQSFFTSLLPHASGVTVLNTALADDKPTLAKQLAASGYSPAVIGKMHFNRPGEPGLHGFAMADTEDVVAKKWAASVGPQPAFPGVATKPKWHPFKTPARVWLDADKLPFPRNDAQMEGTYIADRASEYLHEHKDKPFALWVSFRQPHSPFDFPVEDHAAFDPAKFAVPKLGPDDYAQVPMVFRDLSDEDKQGIIASYYTAVKFLDRNVGRVLATLRELNLENDTLVIYMADHGYSLGQHGRFEKHVCYEPALRVPLIVRWPGRVREGATVEEFTESVDVPPTILELLGAKGFAVNQGRSLAPYLLEGKRIEPPREFIFSEYLENEEACIRDRRWKFIYCTGRRLRRDGYLTANPLPGRTIRLFDLENDPEEFHDVAAANGVVVEKMQKQMLGVFRETHPEAGAEPKGVADELALDWYLRPRDTPPSPAWAC